jgi:protein required for attachment to host cells
MNDVWILVCDAARARVFEVRAAEPSWHLVEALTHAESRSKASELVSDQSGTRSSEGASVHHNALAPSSSPKEVEKEHFIHSLASRLDQAMRSKRFRKWVLVAPPHVVGMVKKELTAELDKHLMATVDKDLTHLELPELKVRLGDIVRLPLDQRDVVREADKHRH